MSIVFAGTPENSAVTLRELLIAGTPISLVLTRPDAPVGRKGIITPSPVSLVAQEFDIETIKTNLISDEVIFRITEKEIKFAIVVAFGVLLKQNALDALPGGWFNLHYSLLPRWRGAAPVQHAILAGDSQTGVTLFRIDQGLDTGPVIASISTEIFEHENSADLLNRLSHLGTSLLLEQIPAIAAGIVHQIPQSFDGVTLAPKLNRQSGRIDFGKDSAQVELLVRSTTPEPGAWTTQEGQNLKVLDAWSSTESSPVGTISNISGRILVGCKQGSLQLITVQPAGKTAMVAEDWFRGLKDKSMRLGIDD